MRPPSQKFQSAFRARFTRILQAHGARVVDGMYHYRLATEIGTLGLSIHDRWIAGRFAEPARAAELQPSGPAVNRHSGKWNWHYGGAMTFPAAASGIDDFARMFESALERIHARQPDDTADQRRAA